MLQKIAVKNLAVGMFVVDTGLSWLEHPYLYAQEGEVPSDMAVREIVSAGYTEVFIDTDRRGQAQLRVGDSDGDAVCLADLLSQGVPARACATVPLVEELQAATAVYKDCLCLAHDMLADVKAGGAVDIESPRGLVEDLMRSASRNPDALIALSKLRNHDVYTFTHGVNVAVLAVAFGTALGVDAVGLRELGLAGLFHDLGKTGVPDAILNKPGRLDPGEFDRVKSHPQLGRDLLEDRGLPEAVLRGVAEHHEKWGGTGYPKGLSGEDVHAWGRIIGVVDVFDALTSRRAYKEPVLPTRALGVLYSMRERDFPPGLVERFIKFMGPYPVGSFVRLVSSEHAFVRGSNPSRPLFPELVVSFDRDMRPTPRRVLPAEPDAKGPGAIAEALNPAAYGIDPMDYLCRANR